MNVKTYRNCHFNFSILLLVIWFKMISISYLPGVKLLEFQKSFVNLIEQNVLRCVERLFNMSKSA